MSARYQVIPVHGIPLVKRGDDIALLIADALNRSGLQLQAGDIVVVSHKIVSVSEGCVVPVSKIRVSEKAYAIARMNDADPFKVELALEHSVGVLRESPVLITVTPQGIITDYAGVDRSNTPEGSLVTLPPDPDASASRIREDIRRLTGTDVGVIIVDTQGRPWRQGAVNVAIGASGVAT
ncbi:MAG: coenzyme F420-0:L-glutamate ligase, partial [Candidatus Thorarchaeota archaeon]